MPSSEAIVVVEPLEGGGSMVWVEVDGKVVPGRVVTLGERLRSPGDFLDPPAIEIETLSGLQERRAIDTGRLGAGWPYTESARELFERADAELKE